MDVEDRDDVGKIVEYAPNLIYVYDQVQHKNAYVNRCIGEKLGYSAEVIQRMGADFMPSLIHPDDLPRVFEHFSNIRNLNDGEIAALEYRIKHCQGHWVWLLSHDTVYRRDACGKVTHHIGAASDISAQKQSEADALAAQAKEAVTNQELREFAYAISHDMKAPSNTMKLILTELEEELSCAEDSAASQLLGLANITVGRMIRLVEDVLHFTMIVGQETKFETVDLGSVFDEVLLLLKADIQARHAKVTIEPMPHVKGSETQLIVLFQNLVRNAITFVRAGTDPLVHVAMKEGRKDNSVVISVCDNGIGIAEDHFDQIFQMFKKLETDLHDKSTGLGLAICRRIALSHRSSISMTSHVGEGSTFSIELDLA